MTSEKLPQLISNTASLSSIISKDKDKNINKNLISNPLFDINAEKFVPLKEKLKQKNNKICNKNNNELSLPSSNDYISSQMTKSYDNMLKNNIRSFNLYEKKETEFKSLNLNVSIIELNFKFTCDYESIENEIKKFLELFGEINSILFDVNTNSVKIIYKNDLSVKNVIHYLRKLLYEKSTNEEQEQGIKFDIKQDNDISKNEDDEKEKDKVYSKEKQSEDIIKFINFLTDNYKNEQNNKNNENNENNENKIENKADSNEEKEKKFVYDFQTDQQKNVNSNILPKNKNISSSEEKSNKSNDNNNENYLYILENLETPEKKLNNINTINNCASNNNSNSKQQEICKNYATSISPFNPSLKAPLLYVPFVPKISIGIPISIPVLLPINSTLLNKSFKDNTKMSIPKDAKEKTSINYSSFINQVNKDEKINNDNSKKVQDANQIKEIFENLNNKIAFIESNSNDINNSNNIKEENKKTNQQLDNNNNNFINKKDFTDKKDEIIKNVNKNLSSMFKILLIPNFPAIQNLQKTNNDSIHPMKPNPIEFNKNVIDFNKLTLETKNRIHFMTHSSRNYNYKYVCNYAVQIENDSMFMVTKRIIGKNGCFLKKILQESCIKYGDYSTKIRLRGKGSGYVDKGNNPSSDNEPLTLSVSSLNYPTYYNCCLLIDNLMKKVYDDYYEYLHEILPKEIHYSISKKKLIKSEFIVDRVNSAPLSNSNNDKSICDTQNNTTNENKNEINNKNNEDEQ